MIPPPPPPRLSPRLLPFLELEGDWQMAIDAWLLEQGRPALRFYRWRRPTLSLGFHQRHLAESWCALQARGELQLVRRPSGGQVVLHGSGWELTYALIWPGAPRGRREAYRQVCGWLQTAFADLGLPLQFGDEPVAGVEGACFASRTAADLVHANGAKRIGSAQLWRRGCLLQHGSILLRPPPQLWRQLFASAPPALPPLPLKLTSPESKTLEHHLLTTALQRLPVLQGACLEPLGAAELAALSERVGRYALAGSGAADGPLASPAATIPRTTWGRARPSG